MSVPSSVPRGPMCRLVEIAAPPPSLADNSADIDRLRRQVAQALGPGAANPLEPSVAFDRLPHLAREFRRRGFRGWALVNDCLSRFELVDFFSVFPACLPAVALDLGTTMLEARMLDLVSGATLATARRENPQIPCGDDILTRIHHVRQDPDAGRKMQELLRSAINGLLEELTAQAPMARQMGIRAMAVAGNTTMTHFLLGLDSENLWREPYIPTANIVEPLRAAAIGLSTHAAAPLFVFPSIASYCGGDLVAGLLATGIATSAVPAMLIDVGTNAEVAVGCADWILASAGAAGPALEGGIASMGMRAGPGAIERVELDAAAGRVSWKTVDGSKPRGICGSGLIELAAGLYLAGVIDFRGRFRTEGPPHAFRHRLRRQEGGTVFVLADESEAAGGQAVTLSQIELDAVLRSKAAMYAILETLMHHLGMDFSSLARICVAGAFGRHISPRHAIVLGMLPDLDPALFEDVGNSSLAGACLALLDKGARQQAFDLPRRISWLELNVNQEFMLRFSGARVIPHTDPALFPSVPAFRPPAGLAATAGYGIQARITAVG